VSDKAVYNHECGQNGAGNVGRLSEEPRIPPNEGDEYGQSDYGEENAAAVNRDATDPFLQIVALGFKHEPFVAEV